MPWCDSCREYLLPNAVKRGAGCPECGSELDEGVAGSQSRVPEPRIPWHFWLLIGSITAYLGYRFLQLVLLIL